MKNCFNCWGDAYRELRTNGYVRIGKPYTESNPSEVWFHVEEGFAELKNCKKVLCIWTYTADAYYKLLNK